MKKRHEWSDDIAHTINWNSFTRAVKMSMIPAPQLMKLVHEKLPTRREQAKHDQTRETKCHYCESPETFTHLLRCENSISQTFRDALLDQLHDYVVLKQPPVQFQHALFTSLQYWLNPPSGDQHITPPNMKCLIDQQNIGWHLFPKGLLANSWSDLYKAQQSDAQEDATNFIAGLVSILWEAQLQLWRNHLDYIHTAHTTHPGTSLDKVTEYKQKIRQLHSKKQQCLHIHRDRYFYPDVEEFLATSTASQMRTYLHNYEDVIAHSIQMAQKTKTPSLLSFSGFTRATPDPPPILFPPPSRNPITQPRGQLSNNSGQRGNPIIQKHTRWRTTLSKTMKSIRDYFPKPAPD
jgi:hypothetical protein